MKKAVFTLFFGVVFTGTAHSMLMPAQSTLICRLDSRTDFEHKVGVAGSRGWVLDHKRDQPGYALTAPVEPLLLEPGLYRATFVLRRGHYPDKGLLHKTYGVARIELWDATKNELINQRELQRSDFSSPTRFEERWMEFSMEGRAGHRIEPRMYWLGLANTEIESVRIDRHPEVSAKHLEEKTRRLNELQEKEFLENGYVVSRNMDGTPDELGDAVTYTGLYTAALAWKYGVTKNELTLQALENSLNALHNAIKGTHDEPIITRFVDENGSPLFKSPSKDVYTAFFLAYSAAYPLITNEALKKQMRLDMERIGDRFLQDNLTIQGGSDALVSLTPYFTEAEVRHGISKLMANKKMRKSAVKGLKKAGKLAPFAQLWPGIKQTIKIIEKGDAQSLYGMVIPTLNGVGDLVARSRDILREQYRAVLFPIRGRNRDYPGKQLELILTDALNKFPLNRNGRRFDRLSDLPVLSSNALLSLHIVKTAAVITKKPQFTEYYRTNLYTQDALLKCALEWYGMEEELTRLTAGNAVADRQRRGYLSAMALYNLSRLETNPEIKKSYKNLLERHWSYYRNEDNPMMAAFEQTVTGGKSSRAQMIMRALDQYPEDRRGLGGDYWKSNGKKVAENAGGGILDEEYSREPLPVSMRPRDSFLWQRSPRRLSGDWLRRYPATDYLFVYWFCRYHGIIPAPDKEPFVKP